MTSNNIKVLQTLRLTNTHIYHIKSNSWKHENIFQRTLITATYIWNKIRLNVRFSGSIPASISQGKVYVHTRNTVGKVSKHICAYLLRKQI